MTQPRSFNCWLLFAVVVGAIALFMDHDYYYTLLNFIGIHTLLVVGLNLLLGYAGQPDCRGTIIYSQFSLFELS